MADTVQTSDSLHTALIRIPEKPSLLSLKNGCIKVRLYFSTSTPKHARSLFLRSFGLRPPFIEDVCVLIPRHRTFDILEAYMPHFEQLRRIGAVPFDAQVYDFKILDEDSSTLAYIF